MQTTKNRTGTLALIAASALMVLNTGSYAADMDALANSETNMIADGRNYTTNSMDVDNTGKNVRDRNGQTRTPFEQGNSQEDIRLTRQIRRSIVSETNNFSMTARNIKIITRDGKVTLRGPVVTDEEKFDIVKIARQIAGEPNVNDLLEVKQSSPVNTQTNSQNQN